MVKGKRGRGHPTKYDPKTTPQIVKEMCEKGLINTEIAQLLGITVTTFYEWQNKYPDLAKSIKAGKNVIDDKVAQALYNRTKSTMYTETTKERNAEGKMVITKKVKKYLPSDVTAQRFWLNNRRPKEYRERHEITGPEGGPIGIVFIPEKVTPEEWIEDANSDKGNSVEPAAETDTGA